MNKKQLRLVGFSGILLLIASFAVATVSAFPENVVREKTFVTYYYGYPLGTPGTDSYNVYAYDGIHWAAGKLPITYYVSSKGAPSGVISAVKNAFETWDALVGDKLFKDSVQSINAAGNKYDGKNVVSWSRLGRGIIAQTTVWYNTKTLEIVEFGMVFSTAYKWGIDADGEGPKYVLTKAFDVQDIATHEAGHTLMLEDLYMPEANALTMYGYGSYGQTYAISLGVGDISGIKAIYP